MDAAPRPTRLHRLIGRPVFTVVGPAAVTVVAFIGGIAFGPLAGTEGLRAMVGHQMLQQGHWLVPRLYGAIYMRKPPLHPWTLAVTEAVTGTAGQWVWRLPSVLAAAVTAAWLAWCARRWFGSPAGLVAGFGCLALVPLWAQTTSADIDAINTLAAVVSATALVELGFGPTRRRWAWSLVLGAAFAAMWLAKGPAGMPAVLGVLIGSTLATRRGRWLLRPGVWLALLAGLAAFAAWYLPATARAVEIGHAVSPGQTSAAAELLHNLTPSARRLLEALLTPLALAAYSFPVGLAAWVALWPGTRAAFDDDQQRLIHALVGGFIGGLLICAAVMITDPRYGYMVLPLAAPLAGAVAVAWRRGTIDARGQTRLRQLLTITAVILAGLAIAFAGVALNADTHTPDWTVGLRAWAIGIIAVAAVGFGLTLRAWIRQRIARGVCGLAALIVLAAMGFSLMRINERHDRSWRDVGLAMRDHLNADGASDVVNPKRPAIMAGEVVRNHPEAFWYGRVDAQRHPAGAAGLIASGEPGWLVLDPGEVKNHLAELADRIAQRHPLPRHCLLLRLRQ